MGIMSYGMIESLRDAQDDLNVRLDAILVELRTIHVLLEEMGRAFGERPADDPIPVA